MMTTANENKEFVSPDFRRSQLPLRGKSNQKIELIAVPRVTLSDYPLTKELED